MRDSFMKKVFFISSIVLGMTLLLLGVYNFAFRHNINNPLADEGKSVEVKNEDEKASPKEEIIRAITDEKVLNPTYNVEENAILYIAPQEREIKKMLLDTFSATQVMALSGKPSRAIWSPSLKQALVKMEASQETKWYLVDLENKTETPLKKEIETIVWTNLGDRIAYTYRDGTGKATLNIANPDGSDWKNLGDSPFKIVSLSAIPQGSLLAFWNRGNAFEETSLQSVSLAGGDPKKLFSGKFGADYSFSPDGDRILIGSADRQGGTVPALGLLTNQGSRYQNLLIPTLVAKTTWSDDGGTVYYALPGSIPDGSVIPNDYFGKPIFTQDTFWKVDVTTGEKTRIVDVKDIGRGYDASEMFVSDDENVLIFVNRTDGKLYRIKL